MYKICVCVCAIVNGGHTRVLDSIELESQVVMS